MLDDKSYYIWLTEHTSTLWLSVLTNHWLYPSKSVFKLSLSSSNCLLTSNSSNFSFNRLSELPKFEIISASLFSSFSGDPPSETEIQCEFLNYNKWKHKLKSYALKYHNTGPSCTFDFSLAPQGSDLFVCSSVPKETFITPMLYRVFSLFLTFTIFVVTVIPYVLRWWSPCPFQCAY